MFPTVLPLRAIAFQALFLVVVIAVEAAVFRQMLDPRPTPEKSIEYAASVNLFCTVVGWLTFFLLFNFADSLPPSWSADVISFIFFNQWTRGIATTTIMLALIMFFASLAIKQAGLDFLMRFTRETGKSPQPTEVAEEIGVPAITTTRRSRVIRVLRESRPTRDMPHQTKAILWANVWSYSAISIILALYFLAQSPMV